MQTAYKAKGKENLKPRNSVKAESASAWRSKVPATANENFEYLRFAGGKSPNIQAFLDTASEWALKTHGDVGIMIKTLKRFTLPDIDLPDVPYSNLNDPFKVKRTELKITIENRIKRIESAKMQESKLYGDLWANMSTESRECVQDLMVPRYDAQGDPCLDADGEVIMHNDWLDVARTCDPLRLLERIRETHLAPNTGLIEMDQLKAQEDLEGIRQGPNESLASYKKRRDDARERYEATGGLLEPESTQALRFMNHMDPIRYGAYRANALNLAAQGVKPLPDTVSKVYHEASQFKVVSSVGKVIDAGAFVAKADPAKNEKKKRMKK